MRTSLGTAVLWAMIPLSVWASRPFAGCFCSDGHFEVLCPKMFGATSDLPACCRAAMASSCCSQDAASSPGCSVQSDKNCKCRFVTSAIPLKPTPVAKPLPAFALFAFGDVAHSSCLFAITACNKPSNAIEFGPPPDLVVILCHFVI